jgi:hypothetical protein
MRQSNFSTARILRRPGDVELVLRRRLGVRLVERRYELELALLVLIGGSRLGSGMILDHEGGIGTG